MQLADAAILYGVGGKHDLTEREPQHRESRLVRIGNRARTQRQNDDYGAVVGDAKRFANRLDHFDDITRRLSCERSKPHLLLATTGRRHLGNPPGDKPFVHSAVMCWVALDGGAQLADALGVPERRTAWATARDEIAATVRERGWIERRNSYGQRLDDAEASMPRRSSS